jgi:uncharacterized RDD family membrane protein YckC
MPKNDIPVEITDYMMAGHGKRIANYLIDLIMVYISVFILGIVLGILALLFDSTAFLDWLGRMNRFQSLVFGVLFVITYFGLFESLTQRTVGKYVTGTIVVMEDGTTPEPRTGFLRAFCRLIPFEQFTFFGTPPNGLHDRLTKTVVVNVREYRAAIYKRDSLEELGQQ